MTDEEQPLNGEPTEADRIALAELILQLRSNGVRDRRVLGAIESIPRRLFLASRHQSLAYADRAMPIDCGQTISQPTMVAMMTEALEIEPHHRVLEVGTGSGYQAAVLARLASEVYTIERYRSLMRYAEDRFKALKLDNVRTRIGDGFEGWPEMSPFDRIIVTAAAETIPQVLTDQLGEGGILVIPVGPPGAVQDLVKVTRLEGQLAQSTLCAVRFVPMIHGVAEQL
ncbi:protein-L-isoaspartate(D-aspartate) O-methyltransferase [Amorphus sp. MBR-141]